MSDNPLMNGMLVGRANQLARERNNYAHSLNQANANMDEANAIIMRKHNEIQALKAELEEQKQATANAIASKDKFYMKYVQEMADAQGYKAMYTSMKNAHPDSPTLADSGKRFKDGKVKNKNRLLYEAEFDRIIESGKIGEPEEFRVD